MSALNNDNDDENIKDNIGEGEKFKQSAGDPNVGNTNNPAEPKQQNVTVDDPNLASAAPLAGDYSAADYSGYEGYDQQQYDATGYDANYDQSQYDPSQYDASGAGYDTTGYDYNATDYDTSAYQYDTTEPSATGAAAAAGLEDLTTSTATAKEKQTPAAATSSAAPAAAATPTTAAGGNGPTEGRNQSRTGSGTVGPTATPGGLTSGKSNLPQQSSTSATKK